MKHSSILLGLTLGAALPIMVQAAEMTANEDGVYGYTDTPKLPWVPYRVHDASRPKPAHVEAKPTLTPPPADATVLFEGTDMKAWEGGDGWMIKDGSMIAGKRAMRSKAAFGDCQIHLEFMVPTQEAKKFSDRGNNGIGLMGKYEIQIFDSHPMHEKKLYADGQCAAIYGQTPPLMNACRKPGEWQSYDIVFKAPTFEEGKLISPATVTVHHNGVLVHHAETIHGPTKWRGISPYKVHPPRLPLVLMSHGSPVQFRNIWIRDLNKAVPKAP